MINTRFISAQKAFELLFKHVTTAGIPYYSGLTSFNANFELTFPIDRDIELSWLKVNSESLDLEYQENIAPQINNLSEAISTHLVNLKLNENEGVTMEPFACTMVMSGNYHLVARLYYVNHALNMHLHFNNLDVVKAFPKIQYITSKTLEALAERLDVTVGIIFFSTVDLFVDESDRYINEV